MNNSSQDTVNADSPVAGSQDANSLWQVGIGRVDITPKEPIAMAGWGARRISEGVTHPLWAKAIALQDAAGNLGVLVTTDLLGLSRDMSEELAQRAEQKFGLRRDQVIINSSHNHAGPVTGDLLHLYYELNTADLDVITRYTAEALDGIERCIGEALESLKPATLAFEQGLCGFGVNRRRDQWARMNYPNARSLAQVVDHDVPLLVARTPGDEGDEGIRALLFGYACHPTGYSLPLLCGDWCGFAQLELESIFPNATALFVAGCGGDINPLPRFGRYHEELSMMFGKTLAAAVCNVIDKGIEKGPRPVASTLSTNFREATLPLETPPTADELNAQREAAIVQNNDDRCVREVVLQLDKLERSEPLATSIPFPIHVWQIGALSFIALSGEPVVDYSLRCKQMLGNENTWVAGYCNELTSYVPSRRVLMEGGYEGRTGMMEYGWPAAYTEEVEDVIVGTIQKLLPEAR